MDKKITPIEHEHLLNAHERIEIASKALVAFTDDDFQSGSFRFDCGLIIQEESDKIKSIIGSHDELSQLKTKNDG